MNNIYKVIWSKAKNCYVVASEIARSHTKSASGSEKIGGGTRRSLLASLMALSLLCGGLGVASAADVVHVDESATGIHAVYTTEKVDTLLKDYGTKTDVENNRNNIKNLQNTTTAQGQSIATNTNQIANNTAAIANKIDKDTAEAQLALKANATDVVKNTTDIAKNKEEINKKADKTYVDQKLTEAGTNVETRLANYATTADVNNALAGKADKATTLEGYGITNAYTKEKTNELLNTKANAADVYTRGDIDTKLADVYSKTEVDDKIKDEENARDIAIQKAINGEAENRKNAIDAAIATEVADRNQAIKTEVDKEANARDTAIANAKNDLQTKITEEKTAREALDTRLTKAEGKITANETAIDNLKTKDTENVKYDNAKVKDQITLGGLGGTKITNLKDADLSDSSSDAVTGKQLNKTNKDLKTEAQTRMDMDTSLSKRADALEKNTGGITRNDAKDETYIEKNVTVDNQGNITANGKVTAKGGVDAGAGAITTTGAVNAGSLNVTDVSNLKGDVTMDKKLSVTGETSLGKTDVGGALNVTGESNLQGNVILGKNTANTVTVNGTAHFNEAVNMDNGLTVDKGLKVNSGDTNLKNTTVTGNLNVTGTITTDKMVFGVKPTNYTEIDQGKVTSKNSDINGAAQSITSSSTFDAEKNEVGFANNTTDEQSSHKQTSDGIKDTVKNNITGDQSFHKQTSDVIMDNVKDGKNSNNRTQTKTETKDIITDENGNSSTTSQTASENKTYLKDKDGKNTNSTIDTAKGYDKTIKGENGETSTKQDAKDITNTAKDGTITNTANKVTNEGTESVTNMVGANEVKVSKDGVDIKAEDGKKITESVGTASRVVENDKITDTAGDSTVTTENGKGTTFAKTGSTAFSTEAGAPTDTNIAGNQITTGRVDANELGVSDKDGTNSADLSVKAGEGVKASASNGTITGSLDVTAEEVGSSVTDASGKGSTFKQRIDAIMGNVKTDAGESEVTQEGDNITSVVGKGEATNSRVTQKKDSLEAAVTDGTNTNVSYDVANASAKMLTDGTKVNKLQDNLDSSEKTITNGTYTTSTMQSALDITHTAKDGTITNDANHIVNTAKTMDTTVTGKATESYGELETTVNGKETHNVTGDQVNIIGGNQTTTVTGDISNKAKNITNEASNSITEKVGETNVTTKTTTSSKSEIQNADTITSVQQTENMVQSFVGKKDFSVTNVTTNSANASANRVTENGQTSTVLNNKDGLLIQNTANGNSFTTADGTNTGSALEWTNIKGNEISTGKVEANYVKMGYADVMKDLGVRGNAKVGQNLEVGGTSTLKGDVTMGSNATVEKDLNVKGTTTTKTLNVTENATVGGTLDVTQKATFHNDVDITGDVTAKSYKVGDKTYISAAGINANDQKITNVADGSISEGSKDAVNGGQLYGVKRDLEHQVDKVGANAAAMANLRPMEFDPSSKWNIAAAIGNYGSETAAALGAFYRPNDNVMVNLSTAFGTGENMVGGGVSVRLGKGGNKLSREETNALKAQVDDLTARMDALLSVLNPNMSKDFPDVPENHWAYEAVSRLAGNDIVQGYPDGEFHGERTMTRYEMAEIIYNALSRGAEAERELVEEFKPELQAMAASEKATAEKAEG